MKDYSRLYIKRYEERKVSRQIRQIKRLVRLHIPADILLLLIITIIYPSHMISAIRK